VLNRLHLFIQTNQLVFPKDKIILAVSAGKDSMAMMHLFQSLSLELELELRVLHINHNVRGADSDADESLVKQVCDQWRLPYEVRHLAGLNIDSSEDELRLARYAAFDKILETSPKFKIATAHHLDDQLETFLMRLAKGATINGLQGIPVKRDRFIRPMLSFRRSEIDFYIEAEHIPFREDVTNRDTSKLRNHIRHTAIPALLDVFSESFYDGFSKSHNEIKQQAEIFKEQNLRTSRDIFHTNGTEGRLDFSKYVVLPALQRRAVFQYCISSLNPLSLSASSDLWRSFERFLTRAVVGARFQVSKDFFILKNREYLLFGVLDIDILPVLELYPDETVYWGQDKISLQAVQPVEVELNRNTYQEFFCADRVTFPLTVRSWYEGDSFSPLGMKGKKKVSDFFIDQKIDLNKKNTIPLICNKDKIIWVGGMRLDERFKIKDICKKIYKLTLDKEGCKI